MTGTYFEPWPHAWMDKPVYMVLYTILWKIGFLVELAVFSTRYVGYFAHEHVLMFMFDEWPWKRARITRAGDMLILSQNAGKSVELCNFQIIQSTSHPFDEFVFVLYAGVTSHRISLDNSFGFLLFKNKYHHNSCSLEVCLGSDWPLIIRGFTEIGNPNPILGTKIVVRSDPIR